MKLRPSNTWPAVLAITLLSGCAAVDVGAPTAGAACPDFVAQPALLKYLVDASARQRNTAPAVAGLAGLGAANVAKLSVALPAQVPLLLPFASPPRPLAELRALLQDSGKGGACNERATFERLVAGQPSSGAASEAAHRAAWALREGIHEHLRDIDADVLRFSRDDKLGRLAMAFAEVDGNGALVEQTSAQLAKAACDLQRDMAARALSGQAAPAPSPELLRRLAESEADYRASPFITEYFKAYFRDGKLIQVMLKPDEFANGTLEALPASANLGDTQKEALRQTLKDVFQRSCRQDGGDGCLLTPALGGVSLQLRGGESLAFKGVSINVGYAGGLTTTGEYPRSAEIAPQVVRVLLEASFDASRLGLPAVATATACGKAGLFPVDRCLSATLLQEVPGLMEAVAAADSRAMRADGRATMVASVAVRGGSWLALNNEAVARSVESLAGGTVRKLAERQGWQKLLACADAAVK
jgi:hypothetical protein